ncbi:MAG TPA: hypothetical protein VF070_27710 [Streptosporangiaceae bacterium]
MAALTTEPTVSVTGAAARVGVDTTGATLPAAATGDALLATVTALGAVARVGGAATWASTPVVLAASEVGASATVVLRALPEVAFEATEVAVEVAEVTGDAVGAGTAGTAEAELTAPDARLVESLSGAEAPEPTAPVEGLGGATTLEETGGSAEVTGGAEELTAEVTGDAAELTAEVTGDAVGLTTEVTGDAAESTVEVTAERGDGDDGVSEVVACACRENTSMITKIPAATIASCTARKAMRSRIGRGMSSSPSPGRGTRAPVAGVLEPRSPRPSQGDHPNLTCCSLDTVQRGNPSEQADYKK